MTEQKKTTLHGTSVSFGEKAVFIRGLSGSGKSDLAFRLIEEAGGRLVSDDQVMMECRQGKVFASTIAAIEGLMEVRGVGLLRYETSHAVPIVLVIDLVPRESAPRLPEWETVEILGIALPQLKLHAFDASTPLKIKKALEVLQCPELLIK
jgi:serine kinase of HPr protein (carbohydrate metabolism regulator)